MRIWQIACPKCARTHTHTHTHTMCVWHEEWRISALVKCVI